MLGIKVKIRHQIFEQVDELCQRLSQLEKENEIKPD